MTDITIHYEPDGVDLTLTNAEFNNNGVEDGLICSKPTRQWFAFATLGTLCLDRADLIRIFGLTKIHQAEALDRDQ